MLITGGRNPVWNVREDFLEEVMRTEGSVEVDGGGCRGGWRKCFR